MSVNPLAGSRDEAYGERRRASPAQMGVSLTCAQRDPQTVERIEKQIRSVGVPGDKPELQSAQAGREHRPRRSPTAEIGRHLMKELAATAPWHQRQERGVVPDRPVENRHADAGGGWC